VRYVDDYCERFVVVKIMNFILPIQIELMNVSVAVVIVGDEKNNTLSWTNDFPPVLLTDDISANDNKCNNFGRIALSSKRSALCIFQLLISKSVS